MPRHFVRAHPLDRELSTLQEVLLGADDALETLPLLLEGGGSGNAATIDVFVSAGEEERRIASLEPLPVAGRSFAPGERASAALRPPAIDLAEFAGERVGFRWVVNGGAPGTRAAVGGVRLRRRGAPRMPDVLVVCSDTHRFDYAFGEEGRRLMPNLQRFLGGAVAYRRAFSNASWTMPAIASTLTGLFPRYHLTGRRVDAVATEEFRPEDLPRGHFAFPTGAKTQILSSFPGQLVSLPERLRASGYGTVLVVSNPLYSLSGLAFDEVDLTVYTGVARVEEVNRAAFEVLEHYPGTRPLFLLVHYMEAHQWNEWYFRSAHPSLDRRESPAEVRESYAAAVRATDGAFGALLAAWERARGPDGSMIVFYSDHGEHLLDPEAPRRLGHGNSMDERLLHVPLAIRYPGQRGPRPGVVDRNVSLVDVLPTVLDVLDLPYEADRISGRSLAAGDPGEAFDRRPLFADFQLYGEDLASVRQGRLKLVIHLASRKTRLSSVPPDAQAGVDSAAAQALRLAYRDYTREARRATEGLEFEHAIDQAEARKQLEALGYIQ